MTICFRAIQSGKASVVTDHIEKITENGVQLVSGAHLDADIIVCATGLELVLLGGAEFTLDGEAIDFANEWTYKGMMCSNIPNMVHTFGYINASWTLRADLIATWVCRLLNHMRTTGMTTATPRIADELADSMSQRFWIDDFLRRVHAAGDAPLPQTGRSDALDEPAELPQGSQNVPR